MAFQIDDDAFCERLLAHDEAVDVRGAFGRFTAQHANARRRPPFAAGFALAAAAIVLACLFTPFGGYARSFFTIFEPKTFEPVDVSAIPRSGNIRLDLRSFGTFRSEPLRMQRVPASRSIDSAAGYHVATPTYLPPGLPPAGAYELAPRAVEAFTFSAAKARASEARIGKTLPPMLAGVNGTTVVVQFGPLVQRRWGQRSEEPALVIVQMRAPIVRSSGATLAQLERYMGELPGVSPKLVDEIRAIGDASSTVPVPFNADKQHAQHVDVNGAAGLAIGDNTGAGSIVMWRTGGIVYTVAGALSQREVLKVADGLR